MRLSLTIKIVLLMLFISACKSSKTHLTSADNNQTEPPPAATNTTCLAGDRPVSANDIVALQQVFTNLGFTQPLAMVQAPGDDSRWYLIEQAGRVFVFANDAAVTTTTLVADLRDIVESGPGEAGLLGIAFDPEYSSNHHIYLSYTSSDNPASDSANPVHLVSHISQFTMNGAGTAIDVATKRIILSVDQPYGNHNGGNIAFGPDNYLYIGLGDGGSGGDPNNNAQNLDSLLGKFLRIDVNVSQADIDSGIQYHIPDDNPFATSPACDVASDNNCPELYAWGVRNPWRWSFDKLTGSLWAGDVGQNIIEEVDIIEMGKNYGWRCYEGNNEYNTASCADPTSYVFPVTQYTHDDGFAITGGYVYRGAGIPQLTGSYIYGDYSTRHIWGLFDPYGVANSQLLITVGPNIFSFAQGSDGEIYLLGSDGKIYKLVPGSGVATSGFAPQLSATGCADTKDPRQAAQGMIHYELNTPLWSDGAVKQRWFALPDQSKIHINDRQDWVFPVGTVLRKDFYLNDVIIETRLLARHSDGGWAGYSYEWNDSQTDATLLEDGKEKNIQGQLWSYPSRSDCLLCHTIAAGRTLGPETAQLNREVTDMTTGVTNQQLTAMNDSGLFDTALSSSVSSLPSLSSIEDSMSSVEKRARSYLHANCSHCHQPGGTGRGNMDFRYDVDFSTMNICNQVPSLGDLGVAGAMILAPGDPAHSILSLRMQALDNKRMPPIGSHVVDSSAVTIINDWINSLSSCP